MWQTRELEKIGKWNPKNPPKLPATVIAAQKALKRANTVLSRWETAKKAPWNQQKKVIERSYADIRRIILFEKSEVALKALKALR